MQVEEDAQGKYGRIRLKSWEETEGKNCERNGRVGKGVSRWTEDPNTGR
jgi:hypothetical protein